MYLADEKVNYSRGLPNAVSCTIRSWQPSLLPVDQKLMGLA